MFFADYMQLYYLFKASGLNEQQIATQMLSIQKKQANDYFNSSGVLSDLERNIAKQLGKELVKTITIPFKL